MSTSPGEEPEVSLRAEVSGNAHATIAGRDVHVHYSDVVRRATSSEVGCPYPGLAAFTVAQSGWFFGRDALTARLLERVSERLEEGGPVMVVAPSGAGKSSLLRAGLLAAVAERAALPFTGSAGWPRLVLTPTAHPMTELVARLDELLPDGSWDGGPDAVASRLSGRLGNDRIIVVVDQLEELFILCADPVARQAFVRMLDAVGRCGVVVYGLRMDAYAHCLAYPSLRDALQEAQVIVGPMTEDELRQAIRYPAKAVGLDMEPGLIEVLFRDLGVTAEASYEPGRLPLLAHALRAAWRERHGHLLTVAGYQATGGIRNAVATTAERVHDRLKPTQRQAARTLFLRLVKIGTTTEDTRRIVQRTDLRCDPDVLALFTESRLLTQEADTVTITHEALLRAWPRLRDWIDEDRTGHLVRQNLEEAAVTWDNESHDATVLWRGNRLDAARAIHQDLSATGNAFYTASVRHQTRARRRRKALTALLAVLALVATTAAVVALDQTASATAALKRAVAESITLEARRLHGSGQTAEMALARQLDLAAWNLLSETPVNATLATGLTIDASVSIPVRVHAPTTQNPSESFEIAVHPTGKLLAVLVGGQDTTLLQLWDISDPAHIRPTSAQVSTPIEYPPTSVVFSPDGDLLLAPSDDGRTYMWGVADPSQPKPLPPLGDSVGRCDERYWWAPQPVKALCKSITPVIGFVDRHVLAVGQARNHDFQAVDPVRLWDISRPTSPRLVGELAVERGRPTGLVATDWRHHLAVTSDAGGAENDPTARPSSRVWRVVDPGHPEVLGPPSEVINSGAFVLAPTGEQAAMHVGAGTRTNGIALLGMTPDGGLVTRGSVPSTTTPRDSGVMAYSLDGGTLASGFDNQFWIEQWNVRDPDHPDLVGQPLVGHPDFLHDAQYTPNGLVSASGGQPAADGTLPVNSLILWTFDTERNVRRLCASTPQLTEEQWRQYLPGIEYAPSCRT